MVICVSEESLARWLEGSLDEAAAAPVVAHLAACDDCRRAVTLSRLAIDSKAPELDAAGQARALSILEGRVSDCAEPELLARFLEHSLDPDQQDRLTRHVADCDDCRRSIETARIAIDASIRPMTATGRHRAMAVVTRNLPFRRFRIWPAAAAAAIFIGVTATFVIMESTAPIDAPIAGRSPTDPPSAMIRPSTTASVKIVPPSTPPPAAVKSGEVGVTWVEFDKEMTEASVTAGAIEKGALRASTPGGSGREARLWLAFDFTQPIVFEPGMALRVRYRTTGASTTLLCGAYGRELPRRESADGWIDEEIPLQTLTPAGEERMMTPGRPLGSFMLGCPKDATLDVAWAMLVRPGP